MDNSGPIKESDLIQLDGTIENLLKQLNDLGTTFAQTTEVIKKGASAVVASLKSASGATKEGRKAIDDAAMAADRYERAQRELAFAMSETGKQIAMIKAETRDVNRASVEEYNKINEITSLYQRTKRNVQELTQMYKNLTDAEMRDARFVDELVAELKKENEVLKALDDRIKPHIQQLSRLQKAQQELAYWQSEEGRQLLAVKQQIRDITTARKSEKAAIDPLVAAKERLAQSDSKAAKALYEINAETDRRIAIAKLEAKVAATAEGSYDRLAATYALTKAEMKQLNLTLPENAKRLEELTARANQAYAGMRKFQESTGVFTLGVGDYKAGFIGLSNAVQQVVRELPAMAVSLNTFFLAISNNVPILVDEIKRSKLAFEAEAEAIKKTAASSKEAAERIGKLKKPIDQVISSLFSWQTALVVGLSILSRYGAQIIKFIGDVISGRNALTGLAKATKDVNEELKKSDGDFGKNIAKVHRLAVEYNGLNTQAEKVNWIKENADAWRELNVAMDGVADAENLFNSGASRIKMAFAERARAAAAYKLVEKEYEKMLPLLIRQQEIEEAGPDAYKTTTYLAQINTSEYESQRIKTPQDLFAEDLQGVKNAQAKIDNNIKALIRLGKDSEELADNILGTHKNTLGSDGDGGRDVTKYIENMKVKVVKSAEDAITKIQTDEFDKRKKAAEAAYNQEVGRLRNVYAENKRILEGYYDLKEPLTEQQKQDLETAQTAIEKLLAQGGDLEKAYNKIKSDINYDEWVAQQNTAIEAIQMRVDAAQEGSALELSLRQSQMAIEEKMAIEANRRLAKELQISEEIIRAYYARIKNLTQGEFELSQFDLGQVNEQTKITSSRSFRDTIKFGADGSRKREVYDIDQQLARNNKQLELFEAGKLGLTDTEVANLKLANAELEKSRKEITGLNGVAADLSSGGPLGPILGALGFDEDAMQAFNSAVNTILDGITSIVEAEIEAAEAAVEAAQKRVEAAQNAYDAEIEARNNGYANNVDTARKELMQEKKNEEQKQKILEDAQRKKAAIDTVTQTSSLITAAAGIWSSMGGIPIVGPALAAAAITAMFASFIAAKVKASQVASASAEYGEGGFEILSGGSHASGNDIPLGTKNSKGKNMRAEGGEGLAIINKRNTKRYAKELPALIDSLNSGTFEEKYMNAFAVGNDRSVFVNGTSIDLSNIEDDVRSIRKNSEAERIITTDGVTVVRYRNLRRVIKSS